MPVVERAPTPVEPPVEAPVPQGPVLPTLFGEGYGTYRAHASAFVFSYAANLLIVALLVWSGHWFVEHRKEIKQQVVGLVTDVSPYILPPSNTQAGGGGGGGDRDKLQASRGSPPKFSREQITPPAVVVRNENPKLTAEPTVVGPPQIQFPVAQLGDPFSTSVGPPSSGTGSGGGIGSGSGGGVGSGRGPGVGPGQGEGLAAEFIAWVGESVRLAPFPPLIRNTRKKLAAPSSKAPWCCGWWLARMDAPANCESCARSEWVWMKRRSRRYAPGDSIPPAKTDSPSPYRLMWK